MNNFIGGNKIYIVLSNVKTENYEDIIETSYNIVVDKRGSYALKNTFFVVDKKIFKLHHKERIITMNIICFKGYIKIPNKFITKSIYDSLISTYKRNQQINITTKYIF